MTRLQEIAAFAARTAEDAGRCIADLRARDSFERSTKEDGYELVTTADLAANALIQGAIRGFSPESHYFSEEGDQSRVDWSKPAWVVDPIDGTVNYAYGHPHVAIAIAYVEAGLVEVGVVHAPFYGETYVAVRGQGATLNGACIAPRPAVPLAEALIATGFPYQREGLSDLVPRFGRVLARCRDLRRLAAAALDIAWVATGRLDAAYETLRPWDVAAAGLVAREAGVSRARYAPSDEGVPDEIDGQNVAFAREGLLSELMAVLRAEG